MRARRIALSLFAALLLAGAPALLAQGGHWELDGHYGLWTLNVLKGPAEGLLSNSVDTYLRDKIFDSINEAFPTFASTAYRQDLVFDSSGHNFGAGVRWYPGGRSGSFSLGLAVEKSLFRIVPSAAVRMDLQDTLSGQTAVYNGEVAGTARIDALWFLLTARWDIFPSKAIHPYVTLGAGLSTSRALDDSNVAYTYAGVVTGSGVSSTSVSGGNTKTLRELRDENATDVSLPSALPFVQINVGLKVRLTRMLHAFVDVGVLDGFIANAGLAIRI